MEFQNLTFAENGDVGVLTISRPKALNALNSELLGELDLVLDKIHAHSRLRVLVITGDGEKAFVAGADIKEMSEYSPDQALEMSLRGQKIFHKIESLRQPVIAAVNGFALGGGMELALACDFVIASDNARFGLPEVSLGLIPGYGGTQRLWRSVGASVAKLMTYTGDMYSAPQMKEWGLVTDVVALSELMEKTMAVAKTIGFRGPQAVSAAKVVINTGMDCDLQVGLQNEAQAFS
ncbi:MAG: enoyl-CoA hydratase/isomerase family protein, partial [Bdellovibrionales bacterium]|nr:enoyl-CoA hydratase/isomerase family protein [Bdellovibrionales bacterium]